MAKKDPEDHFTLEKYKLDRQHELELNRATAAYEHATLRTLMVLNGGAAAAFLTLLGAVWSSGPRPSFAFVVLAILAWSLGMMVTALATKQAYEGQQGYSKAYRLRRQAEELRRLGEEAISRLGLEAEASTERLNHKASKVRGKAGSRITRAFGWINGAIVFFFLGLAFALLSMSPWEFSCSWDCPTAT